MYADKELIEFLKDKPVVKCAHITHKASGIDDKYPDGTIVDFKLKVGYTQNDYNSFIKSLNFHYDNGFGGMELFGQIWFEEIGLEGTTWASREEDDGMEWWEYNKLPEIPSELLESCQ